MEVQYHNITLRGEVVRLDKPVIMGILNVTPDSFYEKSRTIAEKEVYNRIRQMIEDGAHWIDIGGYSSRPEAEDISENTEIERLKVALDIFKSDFSNIPVSIDTFRSNVVKWAVTNYSIDIVNDISGGNLDSQMMHTVAEAGKIYIGMHMRGNPQNMQQQTNYDNLLREVKLYFAELEEKATRIGINDLIIDPGFGFSKTLEQNFTLLKNLNELTILNRPILTGLSRKSMIYKHLNINPEESLTGTITLNTIALTKGAQILRVHDVKEAVQTAELFTKTIA